MQVLPGAVGTAELHSIVAQALMLNSEMLQNPLEPGQPGSQAPLFEQRLLKLAGAWRLLLRSSCRALARDSYDRLRSLQRRLEDRVVLQTEMDRWYGAEYLSTGARALLREGAGRILEASERTLPPREVEQTLLDDSRALRELSLNIRRPGSELALTATLEQEASKAERRACRSVRPDATVHQWRRARRWLALHLAQLELLQPMWSEETARACWYRKRLQEVLQRLLGLALLESGLQRLPANGLHQARDLAALQRAFGAERQRLLGQAQGAIRYAFADRDGVEATATGLVMTATLEQPPAPFALAE